MVYLGVLLRGFSRIYQPIDPYKQVLVRSGFLMKLRAVEVDRDDKAAGGLSSLLLRNFGTKIIS